MTFSRHNVIQIKRSSVEKLQWNKVVRGISRQRLSVSTDKGYWSHSEHFNIQFCLGIPTGRSMILLHLI